ncbi:hypothetical protein [Rhizobium ruizarguesonis]|uniref:hypothetical protein n=1 Tax=Rhizobium ruizarguesonis TaxID=2081791 RepID=UPI001032038B|nr:hypothetical protein [Rhizobium ruizarguesonis]TBA38408.1 hypothetical protein ELH60_13805 [Rhizobium ruizarguesonis]
MILGGALFWKASLSGYLRGQLSGIENHVRSNMSAAHLGSTDDEVVTSMIDHARVGSLTVDFENPDRTVKEKRISVRDHFSGTVEIDGVSVIKSFQFSGHEPLFDLRPNSYDTAPPHGIVSRGRVAIGYEGRNDPDEIKSAIADQEAQLKKYLDWSKAEVDTHDQSLPRLLKAAVERRRQALIELSKLNDF